MTIQREAAYHERATYLFENRLASRDQIVAIIDGP